jgi:hypothetical protein
MQQVNNVSTHLHLYGIYAPTADQEHQNETAEFYRILTTAINKHPRRDMMTIVGDFNAVLLNESPTVLYSPSQAKANTNTKPFGNFLRENQLLPINCRMPKPNYILNTFHGPNNRKQRLDYILIPKKWGSTFYDFTTKRPPYSSDHKILIAHGKFRLARNNKAKPVPKPNWAVLQDKEISSEIAQLIHSKYRPTGDLNDDYNNFVQITTEACNILPVTTRRQRTHPWEDTNIGDLRAQLKDKRKIFRGTPTEQTLEDLKQAGKQLAQQYITNQETYLTAQCADIEKLTGVQQHKQAWQLINTLGNRKQRIMGAHTSIVTGPSTKNMERIL